MPDLAQSPDLFANTKVLRMLDDAGRRRLLARAEALTFPNGAVVVQEGDPGDALYIIEDGVATVGVDSFGQEKPVSELGSGAFFGEMAVITEQPRSATVRARGALSVLKIPKDAVVSVLKDYPRVREIIAKISIARTEQTMGKMLED